MKIDPGKLDRKIVLQSYTSTQAVSGQPKKVWSDLATVWAIQMDGSGNESYEAEQKIQTHHTNWIIRYRTSINGKVRISYNGVYYDVLDVSELPGTRKTWLKLKTEVKT